MCKCKCKCKLERDLRWRCACDWARRVRSRYYADRQPEEKSTETIYKENGALLEFFFPRKHVKVFVFVELFSRCLIFLLAPR